MYIYTALYSINSYKPVQERKLKTRPAAAIAPSNGWAYIVIFFALA